MTSTRLCCKTCPAERRKINAATPTLATRDASENPAIHMKSVMLCSAHNMHRQRQPIVACKVYSADTAQFESRVHIDCGVCRTMQARVHHTSPLCPICTAHNPHNLLLVHIPALCCSSELNSKRSSTSPAPNRSWHDAGVQTPHSTAASSTGAVCSL